MLFTFARIIVIELMKINFKIILSSQYLVTKSMVLVEVESQTLTDENQYFGSVVADDA